MTRTGRSDCPISYALEQIGDRWSLLIVRDLLFRKKRRFSDFLASEENVATNILSDRLRRLEAAEIIDKRRDPIDGKRFVYSLTVKGRDLGPMLAEMIAWAGKYDLDSPVPKGTLREIQNDRDEYLARFTDDEP